MVPLANLESLAEVALYIVPGGFLPFCVFKWLWRPDESEDSFWGAAELRGVTWKPTSGICSLFWVSIIIWVLFWYLSFSSSDSFPPSIPTLGMGKGREGTYHHPATKAGWRSRRSQLDRVLLPLKTLLRNLDPSKEAFSIYPTLSMYHLWRDNPGPFMSPSLPECPQPMTSLN